MILVIDAGVTIAWIADDERSSYADAALAACGADRAVVPALWHWEIANVLVVLERKGRIADAAALYTGVMRLPISTADDVRRAPRAIDEIELAQRHGLSVYDAAYLSLAKVRRIALATLDTRLARAAQSENAYFRT